MTSAGTIAKRHACHESLKLAFRPTVSLRAFIVSNLNLPIFDCGRIPKLPSSDSRSPPAPRRMPKAIRCDNGPEYLSAAIIEWARQYDIRLDYIQPGKPQQNAYVERFNRTVRYEWLSQYHWKDLDHVQRFATDRMWTYNHDLGGFTPKQRLARPLSFYF